MQRIYGVNSKKQLPHYLASVPDFVCCRWNTIFWCLQGLSSLERQYTLFWTYSRKGNNLSVWPMKSLWCRDVPRPKPSFSPRVHAIVPLGWKSHTQFELHTLFAKHLCHSVPPAPQSEVQEVFLFCKLMPHSLNHSLLFRSPQKVLPPLHSTEAFLSPNSLPYILHLPPCPPPTVEILFPILISISWVFQVMTSL